MFILHIIPTLDPKSGGVCQAVRNIIKCSFTESTTHHAVCLDNIGSEFLKSEDFVVHALGSRITPWSYSPKLIAWLRENLKGYDRVILHGLWQYQSFALLACWDNYKKTGAKFCVMPHGMLDPYFQQAKGRRIKAFRNELIWRSIEKHIINRADIILYTCEIEKDLAHGSFNGYRPKLEKIVSIAVEYPPAFNEKMNNEFKTICPESAIEPYFLFLSRINPKKGVDLLIKAYLSLAESYGHLPLLVVVGPGLESEFGRHVLSLAKGNKRIIFPGMLAGDAKWGSFYNCEAFILPSHQENFGIAVVEAMACHIPVIITNKINIYKEIEKCEAGLVDEDDFNGIYRMLKTWIKKNQSQKDRYKNNARNCYEKNYSPLVSGLLFLEAIGMV